jgi:peptide deformylase
VIINPRLTLHEARLDFFEGCLSVDGFQGIVPRAREVTVEALNHQGEPITINAAGWYARILQHEIDHLNGLLYIDRMYTRTFTTSRNGARLWHGQSPAAVLQSLGEPR